MPLALPELINGSNKVLRIAAGMPTPSSAIRTSNELSELLISILIFPRSEVASQALSSRLKKSRSIFLESKRPVVSEDAWIEIRRWRNSGRASTASAACLTTDSKDAVTKESMRCSRASSRRESSNSVICSEAILISSKISSRSSLSLSAS